MNTYHSKWSSQHIDPRIIERPAAFLHQDTVFSASNKKRHESLRYKKKLMEEHNATESLSYDASF